MPLSDKTFDIPSGTNQAGEGARSAYLQVFGKEWPHDDRYLRTLAREVPKSQTGFSRCDFLLYRMRETHTEG